MLLLRANLEASEANTRYAPGAKIAALLFVAAADIDAAEERVSAELGGRGWCRMETERTKKVTNYAQFESREDLVGQAFREAQESGFGYVLYPEPGT
jgi:hypothetical protein